VSGTFAPLSTIAKPSDGGSNVDFLRALSPRFIDTAVDNTWYTINPCRTILLFPYITQQGLFDTGIAISNTTMDPWGTLYPKTPTVPQNGACRLFYYGNTNGGAAPSNNPPQTSPIIPAGAQLVFQLSGGGGVYASGGAFTACAAGACVAPLFQGYLFAICDFQYAHGYAFISDYGAQKLAQGYLALVVPDFGPREPSSRSITAFTDCITGSCTNVGLNEGEQLEN
jgi:hypothetical protein